MQEPSVIISILNWNNYADTIQCINTALQSDYRNYEIVIVDNASVNDSVDKIKTVFPTIKLIESTDNNGFAAGHHHSVKYAQDKNTQLLWILNNDIEVYPNTLSTLISAYNSNSMAIYGSVTLKSKEPAIIDFAGGKPPELSLTEFSYNQYKDRALSALANLPQISEVQSIEGSSMLIPLEIIDKYGFMDTSFFMYAEETDYCFRLRKEGIKSFVVYSSLLFHKGEGSFKQTNDLKWISAYYRRRNFIRFIKTHYHWSLSNILKLCGGVISMLKFGAKCLLNAKFRKQNKHDYYTFLGSIHGILGIKGKTIAPEEYI